jgi:hypothetical protein
LRCCFWAVAGLAALPLAAAWCAPAAADASGSTAASAPASVQVGQPFILQPGQSARVEGTGPVLRLGFDRVLADSRCPQGEQCLWVGDAVLQVWLEAADGSRTTGALHTTPGRLGGVRAGSHVLYLLRLDPAPVSGRTLRPGDYRATLMLGTVATAASPQSQ